MYRTHLQEIQQFFNELRASEKITYPKGGPILSSNGDSILSSNDNSGGSWNNGGNWNDNNGNNFNYVGFLFFGSLIIVIDKVIGSKIINYGYTELLNQFLKQTENLKLSTSISKKLTLAVLRSAVPILLCGSAIVILSYILHPHHFREIVDWVVNIINIIGQELGRLLMFWCFDITI